jgi:hypothetical protein
MSYKALGFYSLAELNSYFEANPDQVPVTMGPGSVANSLAVIMEGTFAVAVEEIGLLAQPMAATDDTIVALENAKSAVVAGDLIKIDDEIMIVMDASDPNNLTVSRGSPSGAHAVGAIVYIG